MPASKVESKEQQAFVLLEGNQSIDVLQSPIPTKGTSLKGYESSDAETYADVPDFVGSTVYPADGAANNRGSI